MVECPYRVGYAWSFFKLWHDIGLLLVLKVDNSYMDPLGPILTIYFEIWLRMYEGILFISKYM